MYPAFNSLNFHVINIMTKVPGIVFIFLQPNIQVPYGIPAARPTL